MRFLSIPLLSLSLSAFTPIQPRNALRLFHMNIPNNLIEFSFSRSSGPGGQNVNKLSTKCEGRVSIDELFFFNDDQKTRLRDLYKNKINKKDELVIYSQEHRTQNLNRDECLRKFQEIFEVIHKGIKPREQYEGVSEQNKENRIRERVHRKNIKEGRKNLKNFDL